jgi:shikimate dehydrogenase
MITGTTKLLGIIGDPVKHSLSPLMHNAALAEMGLDYVYVPFPVAPDQLKRAIAGFEAIHVQGFSITIPHKQAIMPLLDDISPMAQAVGAVNTVYRTDRGWSGTNTDVVGFVAPLKAMERDWSTTSVVVLGNGGAARAVVAGCAELGCTQVQIVGRHWEKLQEFQASWQESPIQVPLSIHRWEDVSQVLPTADLVVNTTPVGMSPQVEASPLTEAEISVLSPGAIAYDLIYVPNPTRFLQLAEAHGAIALDGLEMLVQQGVAALEIWVNRPVPVDTMRQTLKHYLGL